METVSSVTELSDDVLRPEGWTTVTVGTDTATTRFWVKAEDLPEPDVTDAVADDQA